MPRLNYADGYIYIYLKNEKDFYKVKVRELIFITNIKITIKSKFYN